MRSFSTIIVTASGSLMVQKGGLWHGIQAPQAEVFAIEAQDATL